MSPIAATMVLRPALTTSLLIIASLLCATPSAAADWTTKATMPIATGGMASGVSSGGVVYFSGGCCPITGATNAYDSATDSWTTEASLPFPTVTGGQAGAVVTGIFYVMGGNNGSTCTNTVQAYDPSTNTWSIKASMPTPRCNIANAVVNGLIYAIGGNTTAGVTSVVEIFNPATNSWSSAAPMPTARSNPAAIASGGLVYVIGGFAAGGSVVATNEVFNPATNTWSTHTPMPTPRGEPASGLLGNGRIYVVGGQNPAGILTTNESYDPATDTWRAETPLPDVRNCSGSGAVGNRLYVVGGCTPSNTFVTTNDVFVAQPLVGWWTGQGTAADIQFINNGSPVGNLGFAPGVIGTAFSFNGANALVNVPSSPGLNIQTALTLAAWVNPSSFVATSGSPVIAGRPFGYQLVLEPTGLVRFGYPSGAGGAVNKALDSAHAIPLNTFTHVAVTYDASTGIAKIYLNGVLDVARVTGGLIDSMAKPFQIGGFSDPGFTGGFLSGLVDEVRLYSQALTDADIQDIFHGAISRWSFDEASGSVTADVIGGNSGLLLNGAAFTTGLHGNAVQLDGIAARVEVPNGNSELGLFASTGRLSLEALVNLTAPSPLGAPVVAKWGDPNRGTAEYGLFLNGTTPYFAISSNGSNAVTTVSSPTNLSLNAWHHLVATYDATQAFMMNLYVDGALVAQTPVNIGIFQGGPGIPLVMGGYDPAFTGPVAQTQGRLDQVAVYNVALTPATIGQLASSALGTADLSITKTANPLEPISGGFLTYTITVHNAGPGTATDVVVTDTLPAGTTFAGGNTNTGMCTTPPVGSGGTMSCNLGDMLSGSTAMGTLVVNVTAAGGAAISNTASVTSFTVDPNPANNSATATTTVAAGGSISGVVSSGALPVGGVSVSAFPISPGGTFGTATTDNLIGPPVIGPPATGMYTITGLAPGTYHVQIQADNFPTQWWNGKAAFSTADTVTVTGGATTSNINFNVVGGPNTNSAGGITGQVTQTSMVPIPNAGVSVTLPNGDFVLGLTTNANGIYNTNLRLAPGNYKIAASASGFGGQWYNGASNLGAATLVPVVGGQTTTAVNLALAGGGGIVGRVTDGAGHVIAGASIGFFDAATNNFVLGTATLSDGTYSANRQLAPGTYKVEASASGFATTFSGNTQNINAAASVIVNSGQDTTVNIAMPVAGGITGTITDTQGKILPGAIVDVFDAASRTFVEGGFGANTAGFYGTGLTLAPGNYFVRARLTGYSWTFFAAPPASGIPAPPGLDFTTATQVTVVAGTGIANVNGTPGSVNIALPAGATISGTIRDQGTLQPIKNANVFIGRFQANTYSGTFSAVTDANGQFQFNGLRDGEWTFRAEAAGHVIGWFSGVASSPAADGAITTPILVSGGIPYVNLTSGPVPLISADINLAPGGGTLTGHVTKSTGGGVGIGSAVQILTATGVSFPRASFVTQVSTTDAAGTYTASGLAAGQYIALGLGSQTQNGTAIGWYPNNGTIAATSAASAFPVTVAEGQTPNVDFALLGFSDGTAPRTISGVVKDANNLPVRFGIVAAIDPVFQFTIRSTALNGDGSYTIPALGPRKYFVRIFTEGSLPQTTYETRTWPDEAAVSAGTLVDVTTGNQQNINFTVPTAPGAIVGRVTTASGAPVAGMSLSLRNFFDGNLGVGATTRVDGTFLLRAVPPDDYKLRTQQSPRPMTGTDLAFATAFYTASGPSATVFDNGDFIHVAPGQTVILRDLVVTPASGRITGQIVDAATGSPVVGAALQFRDDVTGATVGNAVTRADGTYAAEGLLTGRYKLRASTIGHGVQWYNGQPTGTRSQDAATAVPVTSGGPDVTNINFALAPTQGGFHGQVFDATGAPLRNVGIVIFDAAGFGQGQTSGFVVGAGVTDHTGAFMSDKLSSLQPGQYFAQARALGYARTYFGQKPDVVEAKSFPITVTSPPSGPAANYTLSRSADITGTISYTGSQTGTLNIGLFCDSQLTIQVYGILIASPVFPQAYQFSSPPPDTRGLLPSAATCPNTGGQYYVSAFVANGGGLTATAPQGTFGGGIALIAGALGASAPVANITLIENPGAGGTTTLAQAVVQTLIPVGGGTASLGNVQINENASGALSTVGRIRVRLPAGLTFAQPPIVSPGASFGLAIIESGLGAPALDDPQTFSFALSSRSRGGAASIVISGMIAAVGTGVVPPGAQPVAVSVTVDATAADGLTAAQVQTATLLAPPAAGTAVFSGIQVTTDDAGLGATRTIVLNGLNFNTLHFTNCGPCDTINFGPGITIVGTPTISADGRQITVTIHVDPTTATGPRIVTITTAGGTVLNATLPNGGTLAIDPLPVVTSAGPSLDAVSGNAVGAVPSDATTHTIFVVGSNFVAPPTPQAFQVQISGTGITVDATSVVFKSPTAMTVDITVQGEDLSTRSVTVINPDGGVSGPAAVLTLVAAQPGQIQGLPASKTSGTSTPPATPTLSAISPNPAPAGAGSVTMTGTGFGTTSNTVVTFPGPNGAKVTATPTSVLGSSLAVPVPATAINGNVTVTVGTAVSSALAFAVTNPRPAAVSPSGAFQGDSPTLDITGTNFQNSVRVAFNPSTGITVGAVTVIDSTHIRVPITLAPTAPFGLRDILLTNGDGGTTTFASAFQVNIKSTTTLTLTLTDAAGNVLNPATFLPSVQAVQVTLDATGKCTAKIVTPTTLILQAQVSPPAAVTSLTFTIAPSALPGTATNEDCEIDPVTHAPTSTPTNDFTIGPIGPTPPLTNPLSVTVPVTGGVASAELASWDWGGKVRITVTDSSTTPTVAATLSLPLDSDGDDLPDVYEANQVAGVDNTDATGVNVLDPTKQDLNANGVTDRNDRFARDGLTNFEKYRGVYLQGPLNGASGTMGNFTRLGAGKRNLFVRARGFSTDPAIAAAAGSCGIDNTGRPVANLLPQFPCPAFQIGDAFRAIGVQVWDVAASFTATTVLPTKSYANPANPTLDMATITYDAANCSGGTACDHSGKTGVRQWQFPTLGFSTFGSSTTYGDARVFVRSLKGYFIDRPYRHQENLAGKFIPANGGKPSLAPITIICDNLATGADNGVADNGECTVNGALGGDVFVPGVFTADLTAMDANNDGCVELPFVPDPTTLQACDPTAATAAGVQATLQQVVRSIATHELGHASGINVHTTDSTDLMYQYSINWTRDGHFSPTAAGLVQIHNKGLQ